MTFREGRRPHSGEAVKRLGLGVSQEKSYLEGQLEGLREIMYSNGSQR